MINPQRIGFVDYRVLCPQLQILEQQFATVQAEYRSAQAAIAWSPLHWSMGYTGSKFSSANIGWDTALLMGNVFNAHDRAAWQAKGLGSTVHGGITVFDNAALLPTLCRVVRELGLTTRVALTRLSADAQLPWHRDSDPCAPQHAVVRVLWGLDVPRQPQRCSFMEIRLESGQLERAEFADNRAFMFWSQCQHRVINALSAPRVVIGFDLVMPVAKVIDQLDRAQGAVNAPPGR